MLNFTALETWNRAKKNLKILYLLRIKTAFDCSAKRQVYVQDSRYEIETISEFKDLLHLLNTRTCDPLDTLADHAIVREKKTMKVVGGFRVLSSSFTNYFSSESTFDFTEIKKTSNSFMELSKLSLLPEHRHDEVLNLVSSYLSQYSIKDGSDYLICSQSINSGASRSAVLAHKYFSAINAVAPFSFSVKPERQVPNFNHWHSFLTGSLSPDEREEIENLLTPILKKCLNVGATISSIPALDKVHNRIDFLTILHKEDLNKALWKKSPSLSELSFAYSYS